MKQILFFSVIHLLGFHVVHAGVYADCLKAGMNQYFTERPGDFAGVITAVGFVKSRCDSSATQMMMAAAQIEMAAEPDMTKKIAITKTYVAALTREKTEAQAILAELVRTEGERNDRIVILEGNNLEIRNK